MPGVQGMVLRFCCREQAAAVQQFAEAVGRVRGWPAAELGGGTHSQVGRNLQAPAYSAHCWQLLQVVIQQRW